MLHKFLNFVFCPQCTHNVLFCKTNQKKCMQNKVRIQKRDKKNVKNSTPIPKTKRSFFTQLAAIADTAGCVNRYSLLR